MKIRNVLMMVLAVVALVMMTQVAFAQTGQSVQPQNLNTNGCGALPTDIAQQINALQPWYCPINQQLYSQWQGYIPIASIAVMLGFLVGSIIFMFGVGFKNDKIRKFGIGEIYEAMASGIVVGAFLYISAVMFGILPGSLVGAINPYATAIHQIQLTIQSAKAAFSSIFSIYMPYQFLTSIQDSVTVVGSYSIPLQNIKTYALFPVQIFIIDPANVIGMFLADGLVLLYSEYYMIIFLATSAIPTFLAPGVIFRAIAPTRALGGMMIAIALAFFIVMPSLFAIVYFFTGPSLQQQLSVSAAQLSKFSATAANSQLGSLGPSSPLVVQLSAIQQAMSSFWLQILFYPSLILAMTYAFITQASQFLGSSTKAMGGKIRSFV